MIAQAGRQDAQGLGEMAVLFRSRLKQVMLERSVKDGESITQTKLAKETGISLATIQRLSDPIETFKRIDSETLYPLRDYFGCSFDDLIERVDS